MPAVTDDVTRVSESPLCPIEQSQRRPLEYSLVSRFPESVAFTWHSPRARSSHPAKPPPLRGRTFWIAVAREEFPSHAGINIKMGYLKRETS